MNIGIVENEAGDLFCDMFVQAGTPEQFSDMVIEESGGKDRVLGFAKLDASTETDFFKGCANILDALVALTRSAGRGKGSLYRAIIWMLQAVFRAGQEFQRAQPANEREDELLERIVELERNADVDQQLIDHLKGDLQNCKDNLSQLQKELALKSIALRDLTNQVWDTEAALRYRWYNPRRKSKLIRAASNLIAAARENGIVPMKKQ